MDSLNAVEKEVDKALDTFDTFYQGVDDDIDKIIENFLFLINDMNKSMTKKIADVFFK
jgi:hypothetical protein